MLENDVTSHDPKVTYTLNFRENEKVKKTAVPNFISLPYKMRSVENKTSWGGNPRGAGED